MARAKRECRGPDTDTRVKGLRTLGRLGMPAALPILVAALEAEDAAVRQEAITAIGRLDGEAAEAVPALIEQLRSDHQPMAYRAAWALGDIGDRRAIEPLLEMLRHAPDRRTRLIALQNLRRLADPQAAEEVAALITGEDPEIVRVAVQMLASIDTEDAARRVGAELRRMADSGTLTGEPGGAGYDTEGRSQRARALGRGLRHAGGPELMDEAAAMAPDAPLQEVWAGVDPRQGPHPPERR
jgi:HEAT repeat protein